MPFERIPLGDVVSHFSGTTELSSVAIGGKILSFSDEFFAEAFHLLLVQPPPSLKGQFGPKGALYSGWETRRHNPNYDWCVLKLGTKGTVVGFDIDTTHFNGNEAPQASVQALFSSSDPNADDPRWIELLPKVDLGPSARHLFKIPESPGVNCVKLNVYPDGGIARFRVYGFVDPVFPKSNSGSFDLAHAFYGGFVESVSDQHFGVGSNLILPGRGKDMGDGWETRRSRQKGHNDWAIIRLGAPGLLESVEIDTAHFMGNFPESCELHALNTPKGNTRPTSELEGEWTEVLPRTKLGPNRRHFFHLENVAGRTYTHVKLTIYPDGGVKRVRVIGKRIEIEGGGKTALSSNAGDGAANGSVDGTLDMSALVNAEKSTGISPSASVDCESDHAAFIQALPLTPEAFAPFGQVVQAYADPNGAPRGTRVTSANQGTATKFHKLAPVLSSYPPGSSASTGLSVYRCKPTEPGPGEECTVSVLERHPYTNQAFIPMGCTSNDEEIPGEALRNSGKCYLVVVAKNGKDGGPDLGTLRAFIASAGQSVVYNTAVWHQPMTVLGKPMDFTCVETQIGNGDKSDCEVVELGKTVKVKVTSKSSGSF